MLFQIREIILWPRDEKFEPRRVPFALGQVNVISGSSRTGKSAVIPIIDYCLGARSCSIPVNTIRRACSWFGVVVTTSSGDKLFARREPGAQRLTDDMYVLESGRIQEIPRRIEKNATADGVRRMLDEIAGLSNLDFGNPDEAVIGFDGRPSFRDMAAFTFQPQNVVANPDVLFFKTNTYEHREKLRKIFPYVLGAITPALMVMQQELKATQAELRRKERELRTVEAVSAQWFAELSARVSEARELGLVAQETDSKLSRDQMLTILEEIVQRTDLTIAVSGNTISDALKELNHLEGEESAVSRELTSLRHRQSEMSRIQTSTSNYHEARRIQRDRLEVSAWFGGHVGGAEGCPVCGNSLDAATETVKVLQTALREIEVEAGTDDEIPAAFDREMLRVQSEVKQCADRLRAIQVRKVALSGRSQQASEQQFQARKAERFVGNLENALSLHRKLGDDADMRVEFRRLQDRERALIAALRGHDIESRRQRALKVISSNAGRLLPGLDAERPNDPVFLETNDLTIKVTGVERDDYLSEIGSGSNWLAYHIAMMLGLHQFFMSLSHSPVPSFLILDQPSQVYFPKRVQDDEAEEPVIRDEDVEAVRKAFAVLANVVSASKGRLQVIVLDHAHEEIWGSLSSVVSLEEWRNGKKLVPTDWLV